MSNGNTDSRDGMITRTDESERYADSYVGMVTRKVVSNVNADRRDVTVMGGNADTRVRR